MFHVWSLVKWLLFLFWNRGYGHSWTQNSIIFVDYPKKASWIFSISFFSQAGKKIIWMHLNLQEWTELVSLWFLYIQRSKHKIVIEVPIQMCIYSSLKNTIKTPSRQHFYLCVGVLQLCISFSKQHLAIFIQSFESFITHIFLLLDTIPTLECQYWNILSKKTKIALLDWSISKQIPATLFQIFMEYWDIYDTCWQIFSSVLGNDCNFPVSVDAVSAAHLSQPLCSAVVTGHASAQGTILQQGKAPVFQPCGSRIWFALSPVLIAFNNKMLYFTPAWPKQYR